MSSKTKLRATELLIAVAAVSLALVWAERTAWRQISSLRSEVTVESFDRFHSADELRAAALALHERWRAARENGAPSDTSWLDAEHGRIKELIRAHARKAGSPEERDLLRDIDGALDTYAGSLRVSLKTDVAAPGTGPSDAAREATRSFERILALAEQLQQTNRAAAERFVAEIQSVLTRLQQFLFLSLLGLLLSGAVIVAMIYRRTIAPLRTTLAESRSIIERQEKLASLGVFATGIAHEIRNPLTAIKVRLFTLKSSRQPGTSDYEDLEVIGSEIDRLERTVQDFLKFARPADPELQLLPVTTLLETTRDLLQSGLAEKSVELKLEAQTDQLVRIDLDKMKQVLINFIQNGADSIEGAGTVTVRARKDRQPLNGRTTDVVVIDIIDTGKGMPTEVQKRLFDPFFTTKEKGTGLGMPIAARIVEKHGGVIQYETAPGRGTTFSILLPSAPKHEIESSSAAH